MGSIWSLPVPTTQSMERCGTSQAETCKRIKMTTSYCNDSTRLIPSFPDEISFQILARIPRICHLGVKLVSRSWKAAITSHEIFILRKELGITEEWLYVLTKVEEDRLIWHGLDPQLRKWQRLPPMPDIVSEEESKSGFTGSWMWNVLGSSVKIADYIRAWLGKRDVFDQVPFCGCASGSIDGCLYVVGGFFKASAMNSVWRYDPCQNLWQELRSMTLARAFSKTGLLDNKLYVVGGVTRGRGGLTPLKSAEVFDPHTGLWSQVPSMPFRKAEMLPTAFLADMLKPIATGMTSYRGRLCVPQSLYCWPFFVDVGGEIYDPETNAWTDMPSGMGDGWPARQAGTKLSVVVNGDLYALDPSSSLDSGKIQVYDQHVDEWKVVIDRVPVHDFTDSESPYLLACLLGKLLVITKDPNNNTTILQADLQNHIFPSPPTSTSTSEISAPESTPSSTSAISSSKHFYTSEGVTDVWQVLAAKNFGVAELVSCQVLNI